MTYFVLMAILIFLAIVLPLMTQPLSFGMVLLFYTLFASVSLGFFTSTWYAYMVFIVFVGGLLVMFACALII